jgi:hypothetical protein
LNQNRNNNRRRGRGGNRGQGGGNQGNRIDSRARGNAPQMLEKYRKLAHDASLNGDRVQTEYYLQFADHYFRVVADTRAQRDDQRPRNPQDREFGGEEREPQNGEYGYDYEDETADGGRQANGYAPRRERTDEPAQEGEQAFEGERADEAAEANPFVREDRGNRNRGPRGPRRQDSREAASREPEAEPAGFDAAVLPPSIAREPEVAPKRARTRRPRAEQRPDDDTGNEAVEAFG